MSFLNCSENPHRQRIVLFSENNFKKVKTTFYYSLSPVFPPSVFPCMQIEGKKS